MLLFPPQGSAFTTKYVSYCKNKPVSDSTRLEYDQFFSSRQIELGQKLNIEDLLIAPVQRLPRYQLLIKDLLKDTRKASLDTTKIEVSWSRYCLRQQSVYSVCMCITLNSFK